MAQSALQYDLAIGRAETDIVEMLRGFVFNSTGRFPTRAWLNTTNRVMAIYVRSYVRGDGRWMDLASVEVSEEYRGRGLFKRVIDQLEGLLADAGYEGLRVENVLTEQFASFWSRRGYVCVDDELLRLVLGRATFIRTFG